MTPSNGYMMVYIPNHHRATTSGMVYVHILVAEEKLGRPLKPEEVVHHINRNRADNRPENLIVFASGNDHSSFHMGGKIYFDDEGVAHTIKVSETYHCKLCGKKITGGAIYCKDCYNKIQSENKPPREVLKQKIRTQPFVSIGKEFGVSDNGVRKWCKSYNLPFKTYEIKRYTDEEWENETPFEDVLKRIEKNGESVPSREDHSIRIKAIDINSNDIIKVYSSISEAGREKGFNESSIRKALKLDPHTYKGFRWEYA